ncbi:MAG: membrane protein insertase YidC [Spirochaetaceae bacterium]|jgi:YidC/Oxa1 family membrane protein insertase|nr:membrane protein insertase YidC [Spirochaetaceae bacterium]
MEKKTVLAVVLSIAVIIIYSLAMQALYPPKPPEAVSVRPERVVADEAVPPVPREVMSSSREDAELSEEASLEAMPEYYTISTKYLDVRLSNAGGDIVAFRLKEHLDGEDFVDMIFSGERESHAFGVGFGGMDVTPLESLFQTTVISDYEILFSRRFTLASTVFTLSKKYTFIPDEYMFELDITIDGGSTIPALNFSGVSGHVAYTLNCGPQIGPRFAVLDEREDYRRYITFINGKRKDEKVTASNDALVTESVSWAAIAGKYFSLIAIPDTTHYGYIFSMRGNDPGIPAFSRLFIERPVLSSAVQIDKFRFYLGPKTSSTLEIYETNKSYWKDLGNLHLSEAANTSGFWAILNPLEWVLKKLLTLFYALIPNYGVAIILVTLLVKLILFPLTKKSSEGTLRMQAMAPKIKELQDKYRDNPMKLNAEMGALYKKEGYNPLSGCLPLLIQIPIFFAMYNLFNNHFDLRGAVFISGWIPDLSQPEYVYSFAPFQLPLLGWSEIRILPFIYVGSQLISGKLTQTPGQQSNAQMKMMLYVMPIVFFFVLYNVPSGLLVYWIMSNILTMIQQLAINKFILKHKAVITQSEESVRKVIAPPKKKKRR